MKNASVMKDLRKERESEDIERWRNVHAGVIYYFFHLLIVYSFFTRISIIFWNINYILSICLVIVCSIFF